MRGKTQWGKLIFSILNFSWCVAILAINWIQLQDDPLSWHWRAVGFIIMLGLTLFYVRECYRAYSPKPKSLDFNLEKDEHGMWWVTYQEKTKVGPYPYRHEAFEWIIQQTKKEMKK